VRLDLARPTMPRASIVTVARVRRSLTADGAGSE